MVGVAQLVEPRIVIPVVVGSSPIVHPIFCLRTGNAQRVLPVSALNTAQLMLIKQQVAGEIVIINIARQETLIEKPEFVNNQKLVRLICKFPWKQPPVLSDA